MKHVILILIAVTFGLAQAAAARFYPATGRIVDQRGEAVAFATVVLLQESRQTAGTATDADGCFTLKVPAGDYTLTVHYLGYEPFEQAMHIADDAPLGDIVLRASQTQINDVVVTGQLVRREADRFVMDVANSPAAIGRDGVELLRNAPGVWMQDNKISINGKSGTRVYVNDRELRMDEAQLIDYLSNLTAANIRKIEVIPTTGADYDADNASGAIRITLRRQHDDGMTGYVAFKTYQGDVLGSYKPSGNISYHSGRWSLSGDAWGTWAPKTNVKVQENTLYHKTDGTLEASSAMRGWNNEGGGRLGVIFEASDRHSLGIEAEYEGENESLPTDSWTNLIQQGIQTRNTSHYEQLTGIDRISATFNYIWKIDTLGSTFKVLADYNSNLNKGNKGYFTRSMTGDMQRDSTYRNFSSADYRVITGNLAYEKVFSPKVTLRAGAKHSFNDMKNTSLYQYERDGWQALPDHSFDVNYREHISALYAAVSARSGRWSVVAGLRGEYTHASGDGDYAKQDYMSLFPNANVSYALSKDGAYTITAQYARNITRPSFWALNPQRIQASDYTYQTGNPLLRPCFSHNLDLTFVLAQRYTLTAGMQIKKDDINMVFKSDPDDPNILFITQENYADIDFYYLSAYLPFRIAKWWTLNINAMGARYGARITADAPQSFNTVLRISGAATFTLPAKFYIDLNYSYNSEMALPTMTLASQHRLDLNVKKRLYGDRFTLSAGVQNILNAHQITRGLTDDFSRRVSIFQSWDSRYFQASLTWTFKAGKTFRKASIESGAREEKGRL